MKLPKFERKEGIAKEGNMKDHIRIRNRLHLIHVVCLILFVLAVPLGYAGTRAISFSRVNPFLGQDLAMLRAMEGKFFSMDRFIDVLFGKTRGRREKR